MTELVFDVIQEADGGFRAECLSDGIVTEGDTWEDLRRNVREVVRAFYFDEPEKLPSTMTWSFVRYGRPGNPGQRNREQSRQSRSRYFAGHNHC